MAQVLPAPALSACVGLVPAPPEPVSFGTTAAGVLRSGRPLPDRGPGWVRARPGEPTRYGTPALLGVLERATAEVARAFPGTAPLRIADLSSPAGGRHPRHGSHRSGRDADLLFYVTDPAGRSRTGRGWLAYSRFGVAVERRRPGGREASGAIFLFDDARNWHLVRTLLLDEAAGVQWIFVSRGIEARLLRWAIAHEPSADALARAALVLHQPAHASPHDDHFHVRVLCSPRERAYGCRNRGPVWTWLRAAWDRPERAPGDGLDDAALVREIMDPIEPARGAGPPPG